MDRYKVTISVTTKLGIETFVYHNIYENDILQAGLAGEELAISELKQRGIRPTHISASVVLCE